MADSIYWIWLQQVLGIGSIKVDKVARELGGPEKLYQMPRSDLEELALFTPRELERILQTRSLEQAQTNLQTAQRLGCQVITPDHPSYPTNLANIDCMPCVLYVLGDCADLEDRLTITMVGTRDCNEYGIRTASKLAYDLGIAGCVVVSGLAVGIDTAAHEGALEAQGKTVGILACGMNVDYPKESNRLKRRILDQGGLLMTEYPFGREVRGSHFQARNRLLSGLASGVVVVQAPRKSGALITARLALEQNRDVFAVPGGIFDQRMVGCNELIGNSSGKIVINVFSILEEYAGLLPATVDLGRLARQANSRMIPQVSPVEKNSKRRKVPDETPPPKAEVALHLTQAQLDEMGVSTAAQQIYQMITPEPVNEEILMEQSGLQLMEVLSSLTELEVNQLIIGLPGKRFALAAAC
ncbi:MAG: DNA-protecting protein DprA [Anaerotruncus sp.]|nr:DNA-protecting protein DprA [Anaerotruncus sp.]